MILGVNHITFTVNDLQESIDFYSALGFAPKVGWGKGAYLALNDLWLCLSLGVVKSAEDYTHLAFSITAKNLYLARVVAKENGWKEWQPNSSEGDSLYLLDPNGHKLELHIGSLDSRLREMRMAPYEGQVWY